MNITEQIERITSEVKAHEKEIKSLREKINTKNRTLRKLASLRDEISELVSESPIDTGARVNSPEPNSELVESNDEVQN